VVKVIVVALGGSRIGPNRSGGRLWAASATERSATFESGTCTVTVRGVTGPIRRGTRTLNANVGGNTARRKNGTPGGDRRVPALPPPRRLDHRRDRLPHRRDATNISRPHSPRTERLLPHEPGCFDERVTHRFALALLLLPLVARRAEGDLAAPSFWGALVAPHARWALPKKDVPAGAKAETTIVETYDARTVAGAHVARLRWTHETAAGKRDVGDSDAGRYTQLAVTAAGLYVLSADMDDAAIAKALQKPPSRSDPPRRYAGTKQNGGRFLRLAQGAHGLIACLGKGAVPSGPACGADCAGEVCVSAADGFVRLDGAFAPGGGTFASAGDARAADRLLIAGEAGVQELSLDGTVTRTLTKTPAAAARRFPDGKRLLFLTKGKDQWRVVPLEGGRDTIVAKLPKHYKSCKDISSYDGGAFQSQNLSLEQDRDFVVEDSGSAACLSLKDRNENMMSFGVDLRVDLKTGKVQKSFTWAAEGCPSGDIISSCDASDVAPDGSDAPAPLPDAQQASHPYDLSHGQVVRRDAAGHETVVMKLGDDFEADSRSPSWRWLAITGDEEEGDYIHRQLFLLDTTDGEVWPIRDKNVHALTARELKHLRDVKTEDIVGESTIEWVSDSVDVLLVDQDLVTPGTSTIVSLPGKVVF
jgi:hypothetical protein